VVNGVEQLKASSPVDKAGQAIKASTK
jgi:hypothetical protein